MELIFVVPGLFCLTGIALIIAAVALATARKATAPVAAQQAQNQNASASTGSAGGQVPGGTIAIRAILGQLVPASGGQPVTVVEGRTFGREDLDPDDEAITRGDHVSFSRVVSGSGTLVIADVLHSNGIEVGGVQHTSGRVQVADGAAVKIGTTEFTFRKA